MMMTESTQENIHLLHGDRTLNNSYPCVTNEEIEAYEADWLHWQQSLQLSAEEMGWVDDQAEIEEMGMAHDQTSPEP
jgi:hypothetical protein